MGPPAFFVASDLLPKFVSDCAPPHHVMAGLVGGALSCAAPSRSVDGAGAGRGDCRSAPGASPLGSRPSTGCSRSRAGQRTWMPGSSPGMTMFVGGATAHRLAWIRASSRAHQGLLGRGAGAYSAASASGRAQRRSKAQTSSKPMSVCISGSEIIGASTLAVEPSRSRASNARFMEPAAGSMPMAG